VVVVDGWVVVIWLAIFVEVAAAMAASAAVATAATVTRISGCILTFLAEGAEWRRADYACLGSCVKWSW